MRIQATTFLIFFLLAGSAAGQQKFEPTSGARRSAIAKGQIKEYFAAMEALTRNAENNQRWPEAAAASVEASATAVSLGQLQLAFDYAKRAVGSAEKTGDAWLLTTAMQHLAGIYRHLGQREKETEWLKKALESAKQITTRGRESFQARLLGDLGRTLLDQGEVQRAVEDISQSVHMLESQLAERKRVSKYLSPDTIPRTEFSLINRLNTLGTAYVRAGNTEAAIKAFERGIAINRASELGSPAEGSLVLGVGHAYLARKDYPRAMENFSKALQLAEARRNSSGVSNASRAIGDLLLQTDRTSEAIPHYKKSIDSIESTRALLETEEFRTSFFSNKGQIYGGIILASLENKNIDDAFNYNERARSRAFLDILGSKVKLVKEKALVEEETNLRTKVRDFNARVASQQEESEGGGSGDLAQQRRELEAAEKAYNDFLTKVRKENKEQASLMNVEPLTLKQVQEMLDPGVTVLEYFIVRGRTVLWIVEKEQSNVVRLDLNRNEITSKVTSFRETITELGEKAKLDALSQELYKLLIEPALPHIRGKELLVIPHNVLHYLPFQALLSPQGKYLIEDYAINYLSSASLMQFTQEKRKAKGELTSVLAQGGKVLTFGNPDLNDPKMALHYAEIEAKEIKSLYPQSTVYLNQEASEAKAKELSSQNDIIHFASHAELNESDPLASAILLAKDDKEDGRLEVREIFGMDLKASLIVLSACETGLGKLSSGDELVGLTRAFIYAGTPSVVASLWNVEDSSTAQLMASFYKNLKTMTKVEALRQAQLQLIKGNINSDLLARRGIGGVGKLGENPSSMLQTPSSMLPASSSKLPAPSSELPASVAVSTSHPYFWAPFILVGEGK